MNKTKALKKMLGLKLQDVRGYYQKMLTATADHMKAFDDLGLHNIDARGDKRTPRIQNGTAIIPIRGIICQHFDFWCWFFDGVATEDIDAQFDVALNDTSVRGIVLDIDSPGGEIGGVNDLANKIFAARTDKKIIAYVSDEAASAGYWLGSSAEHVIAGEVALLGSIGVVASFSSEESKTIDFFSSVSPKKDIKVKDPEGAEAIQKWVDDIGAVFVDRVAAFRGVSSQHVLNNFGKGDVMIADNAQAAGMIDKVGNFKLALQLSQGIPLEKPDATNGRAAINALSAKNNEVKKTMKNTIFAKIIKGLKAELVIVDTDNEEAVIPDDAIALTEIDIPFLEQNLPELVEEIRQQGRDEENGRQEELDDMDPDAPEEPEAVNAKGHYAILKSARRDTSVKTSDVALKLMKAFKGAFPTKESQQTTQTNANNGTQVPPIPPSSGNEQQTDAEKDKAEFIAGAKKANEAKLAARKNRIGVGA